MQTSSASESFIDFLKAYSEKHPPELIRKRDEPLHEWQNIFRAALTSLRSPLPERVKPAPEVMATATEIDHTRITIQMRVTEFSTLWAYLLIPHGIKDGEKRPGLLCLHGHAIYGIDSVCGVRGMEDPENVPRAYALWAVRSGYVVLAPAWWGWTGRDGHLESVGSRDRCNVIQMAAGMYGVNILDLHVQEGQAAFDILAMRPEVDEERIGVMGNSYGGRTAMWLTVFEPRLKACVSSGAMNTFRERSLKLASCAIQYFPGILKYGDVAEIYSLIAPRPLQLQAGEQDALLNKSDREAIAAAVAQAYSDAQVPDNFSYKIHPGGHLLMWSLAEEFFRRSL